MAFTKSRRWAYRPFRKISLSKRVGGVGTLSPADVEGTAYGGRTLVLVDAGPRPASRPHVDLHAQHRHPRRGQLHDRYHPAVRGRGDRRRRLLHLGPHALHGERHGGDRLWRI